MGLVSRDFVIECKRAYKGIPKAAQFDLIPPFSEAKRSLSILRTSHQRHKKGDLKGPTICFTSGPGMKSFYLTSPIIFYIITRNKSISLLSSCVRLTDSLVICTIQ